MALGEASTRSAPAAKRPLGRVAVSAPSASAMMGRCGAHPELELEKREKIAGTTPQHEGAPASAAVQAHDAGAAAP